MKEKDAQVDYEKHQLLLYVEREDGSYGELQTGSFLNKNYIDDYWVKRRHLEQTCLKQLSEEEISPVEYYMVLNNMSPADLGSRVGLSAAKVKKHMNPALFHKMTLLQARKYAEIFDVPVANLFQVVVQPEDGPAIRHEETKNPFVILTTCERNRDDKEEQPK